MAFGSVLVEDLPHRKIQRAVRQRQPLRKIFMHSRFGKHFGLSKSTVHKDLSERLPLANRALYLSVREILDLNKAERHIRGGLATRRKYKGETGGAV